MRRWYCYPGFGCTGPSDLIYVALLLRTLALPRTTSFIQQNSLPQTYTHTRFRQNRCLLAASDPYLAMDSPVHLKSTSSCALSLLRSLASRDRISQYSPVTGRDFFSFPGATFLRSPSVTLISDRSIIVPGDKGDINLTALRESSLRSLESHNITFHRSSE